MVRDYSELYIGTLNNILDKFVEGVYDVVASFDQCSKLEMVVKLGKLNWLKDIFAELVPSDFDKRYLFAVNQHLHFVNYYYLQERDFEMLKGNCDDLVMRDIPELRKDLKRFLEHEDRKQDSRKPMLSTNHFSQLAADIDSDLRRLLREPPVNEKEVQNKLEDLLAMKSYPFEREKVSIPYSTKSYKPDFTSDPLGIAIDVKLCDSADDETNIIDEINADIPAYRTRYQYLLFVIYDVTIIRRLKDYTTGIEKNNPDVTVLVIKH